MVKRKGLWGYFMQRVLSLGGADRRGGGGGEGRATVLRGVWV